VYGGPAPWELVKAQMCEHYGVLPSQLAEEPAAELLRDWQVLNLHAEHVHRLKR